MMMMTDGGGAVRVVATVMNDSPVSPSSLESRYGAGGGSSGRTFSNSSDRFDEHGRRIVKPLSPDEASSLEQGWNTRHHVSFSKGNLEIHPMHRSYFDRLRELESMAPGPKQTPPLECSFLLPPKEHSAERLPVPPMVEPLPALPPSAFPHPKVWNTRHGVTHSKGNKFYHDKDRELFSRYLQPARSRVSPERTFGITYAFTEAKPFPGDPTQGGGAKPAPRRKRASSDVALRRGHSGDTLWRDLSGGGSLRSNASNPNLALKKLESINARMGFQRHSSLSEFR